MHTLLGPGPVRIARAQAVQGNPDLLFSRIVPTGRPADALHQALGWPRRRIGFLSHLGPLRATMSPKSSLPQDPRSVSVALMPDTRTSWLWSRDQTRHRRAHHPAAAFQLATQPFPEPAKLARLRARGSNLTQLQHKLVIRIETRSPLCMLGSLWRLGKGAAA